MREIRMAPLDCRAKGSHERSGGPNPHTFKTPKTVITHTQRRIILRGAYLSSATPPRTPETSEERCPQVLQDAHLVRWLRLRDRNSIVASIKYHREIIDRHQRVASLGPPPSSRLRQWLPGSARLRKAPC